LGHPVKDSGKTREQLIQELAQVRQRVDELESSVARHQNATLYRRLVESSVDWVWMVDRNGNHTFTNQTIESFLGYQPAEILGVSSYQFIYPEDQEPVLQLMRRSIQQKTGWSEVTIRWLHKDGTIRYSESSGQPVLDSEGRLTGFSGIDRDITERKKLEDELAQYRDQLEHLVETRTAELQSVIAEHKQTEEALRESEARWRSLTNNSPDHIVTLDADLNIEFVNYVSPGLTVEQLVGTPLYTYASEDRQAEIKAIHEKVLRTGESATYETNYNTPEGTIIYYESIVNVRELHGKKIGLLVSARDITARKQAEAALRKSDERYRDLYAAMNEGAGLYEILYGPSGEPEDYRVLDINPAYETITGMKREEVVGRTATEIFPGARPRYLDLCAQVVASGQPTTYETYFPPWDKHLSVSVFSPEKGKFATTFFDITVRKRNEENLRQYTERLKILYEIDRAILKAQSPQATAEVALQYIRQLIPCHRITVGLYDFTTQERVVLASAMNGELLMGEGYRHPQDIGWTHILRQGKPLVVKDLRSVPDPLPAYQPLLDSGIRGLISTPLIVQDDLIGSLNLMMTESQVFTEDHVEIACELADQLSIAIWQANLHEQIQHNAAQLEALRRITLDITAQIDLDNLLEAIVRNAVALLELQGGGITLYRPDQDLLEWVVGINLDHIPIGLEIARGEGMAGQVWELGKPVIVENYSQWEHHMAGYEGQPVFGVIGAPIQWGGDFLGTIAVAQVGSTARAFSERDSQLLELFAHQAAIAIQNVRLYEEVQSYASTLEERVNERTAELAEAKQQTETILQNIGDAVILTDVEGKILYANPAWESLTGYALNEVAQMNPRILKSEGTPAEVYETMWKTILGGDTWRGVLQNKRKDGAVYDSELAIAPVKDEQGQINHFVGVMRDVTEERQLTAMKEQFIADAAHDLGNPVAVLQTSLYLLKKDPSQLDRRLARFEHEINRLTALVKDLLTISRLDRKAIDTRMELQDLNTIVRQVVESQSSLAGERKLTLSFDAEQNLPNILIDGKQIERVVVNLVGNALNYTEEGGQVRVRTMQEGDCIVLVVKDTGIGITPGDLDQIFERFYRADVAKTTSDGTGLGLPIVKEIIDLHGGRIEVESEEGQGSTFRVLLPIIR
jgi:PAS domain S-box-containing protein